MPMDPVAFFCLQHGRVHAARVPDWCKIFVGQPRAFELGTSAITHNAIHLGEAVTIRSLILSS